MLRFKRKPTLFIYKKTETEVELLKNESFAKENDSLQLSYISGNKKFGCIVSIDGNSIITLHFPGKHGKSPKLKEKGEELLDYSYKLDDAPLFEQFFFITSDTEFSTEYLLEKLNDYRNLPETFGKDNKFDLDLGKEFEIYSILLKKTS